MQHVPTADELRARLRALDELDRKVVGGLVALCMSAPQKIRDREWLAERFVHVATVAHGFAGEGSAASHDDVERIRLYAQLRLHDLLQATLLLFVRTAADLQARGGPPDLAEAQAIVRSYLALA
jgi:hypothetical protein